MPDRGYLMCWPVLNHLQCLLVRLVGMADVSIRRINLYSTSTDSMSSVRLPRLPDRGFQIADNKTKDIHVQEKRLTNWYDGVRS